MRTGQSDATLRQIQSFDQQSFGTSSIFDIEQWVASSSGGGPRATSESPHASSAAAATASSASSAKYDGLLSERMAMAQQRRFKATARPSPSALSDALASLQRADMHAMATKAQKEQLAASLAVASLQNAQLAETLAETRRRLAAAQAASSPSSSPSRAESAAAELARLAQELRDAQERLLETTAGLSQAQQRCKEMASEKEHLVVQLAHVESSHRSAQSDQLAALAAARGGNEKLSGLVAALTSRERALAESEQAAALEKQRALAEAEEARIALAAMKARLTRTERDAAQQAEEAAVRQLALQRSLESSMTDVVKRTVEEGAAARSELAKKETLLAKVLTEKRHLASELEAARGAATAAAARTQLTASAAASPAVRSATTEVHPSLLSSPMLVRSMEDLLRAVRSPRDYPPGISGADAMQAEQKRLEELVAQAIAIASSPGVPLSAAARAGGAASVPSGGGGASSAQQKLTFDVATPVPVAVVRAAVPAAVPTVVPVAAAEPVKELATQVTPPGVTITRPAATTTATATASEAAAAADADADGAGASEPEKNLAAGGPGGVTAVIEQMMTRHGEVDVQIFGCKYIFKLMGDPAARDEMLRCGGCDALLRIMKSYTRNVSIQSKACDIIRAMVLPDRAVREHLGSSGAVEAVVNAMRVRASSKQMQYKGCAALGALCYEGANADHIEMEHGLGAVVDALSMALAMEPPAVDVVTEACLCIKNIAVVLSLRPSVWHYDVAKEVVRAMSRCANNVAVLLSGCAAIQNLAHDSRCKIVIGEEGAISVIAKAMRRFAENEALQRGACGALYNMTIPADSDPDVAMLDGSEYKPISSAVMMRSITKHHILIARTSGIGSINAAMQKFPSNINILDDGCGVIGSLAEDGASLFSFADLFSRSL